jgi:tetratricopeptide (TPR) repeat protein
MPAELTPAPAAPAPAAPRKVALATDGLSPRAQRLFEEAVQAEEEQRKLKVPTDWAYLERKWRAVLDEADIAEARFDLGVTLEAQGRLADARGEYERARAKKPSLRQASANLGVILEKEGDPRGAAAIYAQIAKDFPEDAVSRERLAALYRASGQLDEAWRLAREALVRDPGSLGAYKVLVRVALQRNDLDLAKLVAKRAEKLDPSDPELPFFAGQSLAKQGDDAAAAIQFQKALALRPGFAPARHALLAAALKKQAWGTVAEHAQTLLKDEPGVAALHLALGIAQRHLGETDAAMASYAQAEKLGGAKLPEVHLARGVLFARVKGECEPALTELGAYQRAAGAALEDGGQVVKLQRECEQMLEENRRAAEAAKQMQAEAEKQAEAAKKAAEQGAKPDAQPQPAGGGATPTSAPNPSQ